MNIIFSIQGGLGKSIFGTAVCKAIKKNYPSCKLIVITGYPDVFLNLDYVDMSFGHGQELYFYQKYIENQDVKIFANEPYLIADHVQQKEHIIETWCKMNGITYSGELPDVYLNEREVTFFANKFRSDKPIMILQSNGGGGQTDLKYSWARDMPSVVAKTIIEEFHRQYNIFHLRREDQIGYENTTPIQAGYKEIACLIAFSSKRLLIDSFGQHLAAAVKKSSTVLWIANSPVVFGYDLHDNILANPETKKPDLRHAVFGKYNIGGVLHEFPYEKESEIFNIDKILASLHAQ